MEGRLALEKDVWMFVERSGCVFAREEGSGRPAQQTTTRSSPIIKEDGRTDFYLIWAGLKEMPLFGGLLEHHKHMHTHTHTQVALWSILFFFFTHVSVSELQQRIRVRITSPAPWLCKPRRVNYSHAQRAKMSDVQDYTLPPCPSVARASLRPRDRWTAAIVFWKLSKQQKNKKCSNGAKA